MQFVGVAFRGSAVNLGPHDGGGSIEVGWFSRPELPADVFAPARPIIEDVFAPAEIVIR